MIDAKIILTEIRLARLKALAERPEFDIGQRIDIEIDQMILIALLARLEAAEEEIEYYREALADMHTRPCRFDEPTPKEEDLDCLACYAFEHVPGAWRKASGKDGAEAEK